MNIFKSITGRRTLLKSGFVSGCLIAASLNVFAADFDGDGLDDRATYRPKDSAASNTGVFRFSSSAQNATLAYQWGTERDFPVPGNYFSTTGADIAFYRSSNLTWYFRKYDATLDFAQTAGYRWGRKNYEPHPCDFNGDGRLELTVFGPTGIWLSRVSTADPATTYSTAVGQRWGKEGDDAIPYDYDGDGFCDYAVFREGSWNIILSTTNNSEATVVPWGKKGDIPVPGQYTSDSVTDLAVFRPTNSRRGTSLWIVRVSNVGGLTSAVYKWGARGDLPVPADFDGDGKTDLAVFRPSNASWYIRTSSSNYATAQSFQFGARTDIPLGDRRGKDPQ